MVFAPKIKGTQHLYNAFGKMMNKMLLFSTDNTLLPADYCSVYGPANLFVDAFAAAHNTEESRVVAINWSSWREAGTWHRYYTHFTASEVEKLQTISTAEGVATIELALKETACTNVLVSCFNPDFYGVNRYFKIDENNLNIHNLSMLASLQEEGSADLTWDIFDTEWSDVRNIAASIWKDVLRLDQLEKDVSFYELGGHSILALKIMNRLKKHFPAPEFNHSDIFIHNTVNAFSEYVEEKVNAAEHNLTIELKELNQLVSEEAKSNQIRI